MEVEVFDFSVEPPGCGGLCGGVKWRGEKKMDHDLNMKQYATAR